MPCIAPNLRRLVALSLALLTPLACTTLLLAAGNLNLAAHRSRLQLAETPGEAAQVLDVQKRLVAARRHADGQQPREVIISGQIGGMPNVWPDTHPDFPWYKNQASFFVVDQGVAQQFAAHAQRHGGKPCAFCMSQAAKNAHAVAVVNLVDDQGEIIRTDARELLGLQENQKVVIRGKAKLLAGSMLVIDADGVYMER